MKVKLIRPARVFALPGEIEVSEQEFVRLQILSLVELPTEKETRETPEREVKKTTRKK